MREIKFRVFDGRNNKQIMREVVTLEFLKNGSIVVWCKHLNHYMVIGEGCVLMQFTGLLDKNGKEIYEGDIVSAWSTGVKKIGEVKQRNDGMWFIYPPLWHFNPNSKGLDDVEIIGNIYENPERLEVSQ